MVGKVAIPARAARRIGVLAGAVGIGLGALAVSAGPAPGVAAVSPGPVAGHHATLRAQWASLNWSGYAVTSAAPYTGVSGNWKVPAVSGPNGSYSATWVGIDGFTNSSLIQTGTEQDDVNGTAQYAAWWTTSAQGFAEQTITSGCSSTGGAAPLAAPGGGGTHNSGGGGHHGGSAAPSASTGQATNVTSTSATLTGTVNPDGSATSYYFEYGTSTAYGSVTATVSAGSGTTAVPVSASISGLGASTTYHFQLVASYKKGTVTGGDSSFTTAQSSSGGSCGAVRPGDAMSATITKGASGSVWSITLADTTRGWTFTTSVTYTGPGASAEWIVEAPSLCTGRRCTIATLADYGTVTFDPGTVDGGGNPNLTAGDAGEIVSRSGTPLSTPSAPDSDTDGFSCAYGSTAPSPPTS